MPHSSSNILNVFIQLLENPNVYILPSNTHTMITSSKASVVKPKALVSITTSQCILLESRSYKKGLRLPE